MTRRGQSLTDYAIVISTVIATLITMQTFIRRYVQAEVKATTDQMLAISDTDSTGLATQRAGMDSYPSNSGISNTPIQYLATTNSSRTLRETSGKLQLVTDDRSRVMRIGDQRVQVIQREPPKLLLPPEEFTTRRPPDARPLRSVPERRPTQTGTGP